MLSSKLQLLWSHQLWLQLDFVITQMFGGHPRSGNNISPLFCKQSQKAYWLLRLDFDGIIPLSVIDVLSGMKRCLFISPQEILVQKSVVADIHKVIGSLEPVWHTQTMKARESPKLEDKNFIKQTLKNCIPCQIYLNVFIYDLILVTQYEPWGFERVKVTVIATWHPEFFL